jgi:phospholipase/carboxylesterase
MNCPYQYTILLPEKLDKEKKYPVIYALHGIGYNERFMVNLIKELRDEVIIIGIRGDLPYEKGYAYYYLKGYGSPERDLFFNSIEKLLEFIDYTAHTYPIDPLKRYFIGFSQGAILSISLALILGKSVAGIVPMNGYVPDFINEVYEIKPIEHLAVFLCQGLYDKIFPLKMGQENFIYFCERAGSVKYAIYPAKHEISTNNGEDVVAWLRQQLTLNTSTQEQGFN